MSGRAAPRPFLGALSAVRAGPALLVVAGHLVVLWNVMGHAPCTPTFARWSAEGVALLTGDALRLGIMHAATAALGFFFQLSGFVLVYVYLDGERPTALDRRGFWIARVARVYPVYALGLFVGFPLFVLDTMAGGGSPDAPPLTGLGVGGTVLAALFLVQAWSPRLALAWNAPAWSLSCEAFFYLLFPWIVPYVDRLRARALVGLLLGCWVASLVAPAAYLWLDPDGLGPITWRESAWWLRAVKFNPLVRLPEFVEGVVLGKLWLQVAPGLAKPRRWGAWLSCTSAVVLAGLFASHVAFGVSMLLVHNGLFDLVCLPLIFGLALGGGPLHWLLERRPLVVLGDATYALYIIHLPVLAYALIPFMKITAAPLAPMWFGAIFVVVVTVLAVLVHLGFEVPARGVVRRVLREVLPPPAQPRSARAAALAPEITVTDGSPGDDVASGRR